ncbi:hypothetical protein CASFOL_030099 [Castilleja foliolosa]|uniref:Uncharacterized protein n=1 Tax=Castilleja foliolosa TaxID=1961234 RepID=A0ABD3C9P2_9LAMI
MELSPTTHDSPSLISFYFNSIFNRLRSFFPISVSLSKIRNFYGTSKRRRRRNTCLPLPLPSAATAWSPITPEERKILDVLEDILETAFQNLHSIQTNLEFWEFRAKGSSAQKAYFMLCERGPSAFISGTLQLIRDFSDGGFSMRKFYCSSSSHISERIRVLTGLRYCMATFLANVYMEVDRFSEDLVKDSKNLLVSISDLFLKLEVSMDVPLMFARLPEVNQGDSEWTDCEITDAINLIYENVSRLDSYLTVLVFENRKPRKVTLHWMRYSCGVFCITVGSLWLFRHSRLMGSSDIDNWIREAKDSTISFWNHHVEQPVVMAFEEMELTLKSLHRTLLALSEQAVGKKLPANTTNKEMLEIFMRRYDDKEISHMSGEHVLGLVFQIQKLQLDADEVMLELDRRARKISSAILAALSTFVVAMLAPKWFKQDTRARDKRVAHVRRRLLVEDIRRAIMQFQNYKDQGLENDAQYIYGMTLCFLDSLYCVVERHAKANGEWMYLRQDIVKLVKPSLETKYKLKVASDMVWAYNCLLSVGKTPTVRFLPPF